MLLQTQSPSSNKLSIDPPFDKVLARKRNETEWNSLLRVIEQVLALLVQFSADTVVAANLVEYAASVREESDAGADLGRNFRIGLEHQEVDSNLFEHISENQTSDAAPDYEDLEVVFLHGWVRES